MRAIVYREYGLPDVLHLEEVETPVPKDDEVLIKVHAASVNSWDWDLLRGTPFFNRIGGLFTPQYPILGADVAGRVEAVGAGVKRFRPGDEVFGDLCQCGWGGFAEYVMATEAALTPKPVSMTFEQAAAIPQAGVMALQGLRFLEEVRPGHKVLMNGAGGGLGTVAVQIAKSLGAAVTAVDSTGKLEMLRSLGADHVIDYTKEDFTRNGERYDLILDVAGYRSAFDYSRALSPAGTYVMIGGSIARFFQLLCLGPLIAVTGKKLGVLMHEPNKDLDDLSRFFEAGAFVPVIDRRYPLQEVAEALRHFGTGEVIGKLIITVA